MALPLRAPTAAAPGPLAGLLAHASIEVMPRTAAKIPDLRALLPAGAEVFVAHVDGTPPADMQATVARLAAEGFCPVPHIPARSIADRAMLADWVAAYRAAGARRALVLAGGAPRPAGDLLDSMQLLDSGLFDGFERVFVAGHPEGNRDIDPQGGEAQAMAALAAKQDWSRRTGVPVTIVTQFLFDPAPAIDWTARLTAAGITLPVRLGAAGPTRLQTLIRYALACGVGASLAVLQRRARDLTKLVVPVTPETLLTAFAWHKAAHPDWQVEGAHLFPLGGIDAAARWLAENR